jgi:hypothetical protein
MFDCYNVQDCRPAVEGKSISATTAPGRVGTGDPAIVGVARPVDPTDPNLTKWSKDPANPIVVHGARGGFQGPSTMWKVGDVYNMLMAVSGALSVHAVHLHHRWVFCCCFRLEKGQDGTRPLIRLSTSGTLPTLLSTRQHQGHAFFCLSQMPLGCRVPG